MNLPRRIDHTALTSSVTETDIIPLCREAAEYDFFAVVVNPVWVKPAVRQLSGSRTIVCSVAGFPLGANRVELKMKEAALAAADGAFEIDMVANIGWLLSDRFAAVEDEIRQVRDILPVEVALKVIIEACNLSQAQQVSATRAVINGGAQFVKTGTGFGDGATVDQVRNLCSAAKGQIQVKAAGGIRTLEQCRQLIEAGATRLGSSSSVRIMAEWQSIP
jgi:deoxyribose-phosphate aldolase